MWFISILFYIYVYLTFRLGKSVITCQDDIFAAIFPVFRLDTGQRGNFLLISVLYLGDGGGRIGKQNMRSKSSCSPGDAPSIHLPVHLPVHHLCAHHLLLKQDLYLGDRLGDGSASRIKDQRNPPGVAFASGSTSETPKHQKI